MKLICDSGSTKADWMLIDGPGISEFQTDGMNPVHLSEDSIAEILFAEKRITGKASGISEIRFFGAGCGSDEGKNRMTTVLTRIFPGSGIHVDNDLMAAALATAGNENGVIAILGTGSNCCYFDGSSIYLKNFGLGYILGDEASGAFFGRNFIRHFLYGLLPVHLHDAFYAEYKLDRGQVIEAVYRKPGANLFLSSFMPFIARHKTDNFMQDFLAKGLDDFFDTNVNGFREHKNSKIHFVGSVAALLEPEIRATAQKKKLAIGKILKRPMDGLKEYFSAR